MRERKPGKRALQWAKTQRNQSRQSYAPCCLHKYARPKGHKWEFFQPTLFSSSPMPRGMGILFLFGLLGRASFNLCKSTIHAGS